MMESSKRDLEIAEDVYRNENPNRSVIQFGAQCAARARAEERETCALISDQEEEPLITVLGKVRAHLAEDWVYHNGLGLPYRQESQELLAEVDAAIAAAGGSPTAAEFLDRLRSAEPVAIRRDPR
jgi:hypothetical protein